MFLFFLNFLIIRLKEIQSCFIGRMIPNWLFQTLSSKKTYNGSISSSVNFSSCPNWLIIKCIIHIINGYSYDTLIYQLEFFKICPYFNCLKEFEFDFNFFNLKFVPKLF